MKVCKRCITSKESSEFYKGRAICKLCRNYQTKAYYETNKSTILENEKRKYAENPLPKQNSSRSYNLRNKDKKSIRDRAYRIENKDRINAQFYRRLQADLEFKISHSLRARLNKAVRNGQKSGSAVRDLGCSIEFFKRYIESLFKPGMSWNNYGQWHFDHKAPLSKFDLADRVQFLKAAHYTNLQPLWAFENLSKGCG